MNGKKKGEQPISAYYILMVLVNREDNTHEKDHAQGRELPTAYSLLT